MSNIALNGYSAFADSEYFGHKDFEDFWSAKIRQVFNHSGAIYSYNVIKQLRGMVWRASEMNPLNQPPLINANLTRDDSDECYFKAVVELSKLKKEFNIVSPGNFVYIEWRKWEKSVENFLSEKFNLRRIP